MSHTAGHGKFLGGAELARRKARKGGGTRILRPGETLQPRDLLSKKMPSMERFFASLFMSPAPEFLHAHSSDQAQSQLLRDICRRLGLAPPQRIQPMYKSKAAHFETRAALVMEESRHAVSEALSRRWKGRKDSAGIRVSLEAMQTRKEPGHVVFVFEKQTAFTAKEMREIRPGCCFEILPPGPPSIERVLLACVMSNGRHFDEEGDSASRTISLLVFSPFGKLPSGTWQIHPITTLISMLRQYEACMNVHNVPFIHALMGIKGSTHTRFEHDDDVSSSSDEDEKKEDERTANDSFILPVLNSTQEKASHAFLRSSPYSITIVQGPPGTGKTTLLIAIICRYLTESRMLGTKRRLMVCAPTNKAVSVLATRYLDAIIHGNQFNAAMIGDQDKLLTEEQSSSGVDDSPCALRVRNIFVYTWIDGVVEECKSIRRKLKSEALEMDVILSQIYRLCSRLGKSLPYSAIDSSLAAVIKDVRESVETFASENEPSRSSCQRLGAALDALASAVLGLNPDSVVRELLGSADIIFCTLASAGSSVVKLTKPIDDLIVDEAAAATEPELYIPFQLKPSRLLVVGDPMQLPATVLSRSAERLGLSQSLHERLMYELSWDHIMLDIQYRMKPEISRFPSARFYGDKITNGGNVICPSYQNILPLLKGDPYTFLHVTGMERQGFGGSYCNTAEAETVLEIVKQLRVMASRAVQDTVAWYSTEKVRIITFYQAQVSLIKRMLTEHGHGQVTVATVDSSQGCEADIVIVSFVRSNDAKKGDHHSAGFLSDDRRLNVALTRAKYQLICVGNAQALQSLSGASTLQSLSRDAYERKCVMAGQAVGSDREERDMAKEIKAVNAQNGKEEKSRKRARTRH